MKLLVLFLAAVLAAVSSNPLEPIQPTFDAYRDTVLLLSTRQNRGNPYRLQFRNEANINGSPWNPNRPTRVLVHGWWEDETSDINLATSEELLDYYDFNVILVDWSAGSRTINYVGAAGRVSAVGNFAASYLTWLRDLGRLDFNRIHVIGFSLGAHIAGFIGKNTNRQLHTIIGLDPAGPLFSERNPDGRIDAGDAQYVECLHTNGPGLLFLGAGIGEHICHADFFPNGGEDQPGCLTNTCSHLRAVQYYIESIISNGFHSRGCDSVRQANRESCSGRNQVWPSGEPSNRNENLRGIFHYSTNRNSPFARGPFRL